MLQVWIPNTLPLPYSWPKTSAAGAVQAQSMPQAEVGVQPQPEPLPPMVEVNDNFPKGRVARYFSHQRYGFIVGRNGREIYFNLSEIDFVGPKSEGDIQAGLPVGYDVSNTSNGLHVKKLKIY